jgi:hypothetical protein
MVLAGILIGAGELVDHSGAVQGFDNHVTSFVMAHRTAGLNAAMKAVTWLGSWVAELVAGAVVLLFVLRRRLSVGLLRGGQGLVEMDGFVVADGVGRFLYLGHRPSPTLRPANPAKLSLWSRTGISTCWR